MSTRRCARSVSFLLVGAFAGSASSSAQVPPADPESAPCLAFSPENTIAWPDDPGDDEVYGSPSGLQRVVVADLDDDDSPEGVVVCDGKLVVLWGLVAYDAPQAVEFPFEPAPSGVTGVAVLPGGPDADGLLVADYRGLYLVKHAGSFVDPIPLGGASWCNATALHVDDVTQDGSPDVYGIAADQKTLLMLPSTSGNFGATMSVTQPYVLHDVQAVHWIAGGTRELVAVSASRGLRIFGISGTAFTYLGARNHGYPGCIARIGGATEYLAWTRGTSGGTSELVVLNGSIQETLEAPLEFDLCEWPTAITPTAIASGDYDGDGDDDLLLVHQANQTAVVLVHALSELPFFVLGDTDHYDVVPLGELAQDPGGVGVPAFAQVDGEGVLEDVNPDDLVFPVWATGHVEVFARLGMQRDRVIESQVPPTAADIFHSQTEFNPGSDGHGQLVLAFAYPDRYAVCNVVDVAIWEEPAEDAGVLQHPRVYTRYDLDGENPYQWVVTPAPELSLSVFPDGECAGIDPSTAPSFYVELRFRNASEGISSRIFTGGFRLNSCDPTDPYASHEYLLDQGSWNAHFLVWEDRGIGPQPMGNNDIVGIFVPMSSQPPFDPGSPPIRGQPIDIVDTAHWFNPNP